MATTVADRKPIQGYKELKADGSTACGCWIYSGIFPNPEENALVSVEPKDDLGHGWGWAWPSDRRILYNRASARPDGSPWSERKKLVWWDEKKQEWTGLDVPDFTATKAPDYRPPENAKGDDALGGDKPFIMHPDGFGWIWVASGLKDGPLPTHYEPLESPVGNALYPEHPSDPAARRLERPDNVYARTGDPNFPYVLTTYRLTEHHTAGGMSRYLSRLAELQPELFCEISPELAEDLGIEPGSWVTVSTARASVEARAQVSARMKPLRVDNGIIHQVGLPYHWGYKGLVKGDVVNDLVALSEEPNVRIMETKSLLCNVTPSRKSREPDRIGESGQLQANKIEESMTTTAFLTDSTLCIGCKACEVACKEWNQVPADGFTWQGLSYDNTVALGHSTWRHVQFVEGNPKAGLWRQFAGFAFVGLPLRRVQALRKCRMPGSVPDRVDRAHGVRGRLRPAGRMQRLRVLRGELSIWRDRT